MVDLYDPGQIDFFEEDDDLNVFDAAFMRGYLAA